MICEYCFTNEKEKMFKFLCFLCLNIIGTDGQGIQKLILEVNGRRILDEIKRINSDTHDIRHKEIIVGSNLNITCKIEENDLIEPSFVFREGEKKTVFSCTEKPCKSISIQINPPPGTVLTCQTRTTSKAYTFSLIYINKLPFVTISVNNRILAVGPKHKELTYKFDQNENILANCTHNTKEFSGIWNFNGFSNKSNVRKINHQAARINLTSEMNNSYIDCEDRSDCEGKNCQPPFIRVTFVAKVSGYLERITKQNMLWIINNNDHSTISTKDSDTEIFHYKEGDMIDFTCFRKPDNLFRLTWYKDNTKLNYTYNPQLSLGWNSPLREKDNGIEFKCTLDEKLGNIDDFGNNAQQYESIIKLQYDSDVTTQLPGMENVSVSVPSASPERYTLIFGSITLLVIIIIMLAIIIIVLITRSRKHKSEDELRLRTPNSSIKSQSTDTGVQLNNTYTNPKDANLEIPTDNSIYETDKAYSTPFSETKEVYALPVPKKYRTNTPKAVIDVNNKHQYYSYANNFKNDLRYENFKRPYENCNFTSDGQSSLYSEINPY